MIRTRTLPGSSLALWPSPRLRLPCSVTCRTPRRPMVPLRHPSPHRPGSGRWPLQIGTGPSLPGRPLTMGRWRSRSLRCRALWRARRPPPMLPQRSPPRHPTLRRLWTTWPGRMMPIRRRPLQPCRLLARSWCARRLALSVTRSLLRPQRRDHGPTVGPPLHLPRVRPALIGTWRPLTPPGAVPPWARRARLGCPGAAYLRAPLRRRNLLRPRVPREAAPDASTS